MRIHTLTIPYLGTLTLLDHGPALKLARPVADPDCGPSERGICCGRLKLLVARPGLHRP